LLFNGIGANWELAKPFLEALTSTTAIIFDVPGVGGSPRPLLPYRPSTLARLAAGLVAELGYAEIDVAGVSWGGGIAQQFAHQYPKLCRRLVLAATAPGVIMVPASPSVLWKMATPRRYTDKDYMNKDRGGYLWRRLSQRSVIDRPACGRDARRAQPGLPVSASCRWPAGPACRGCGRCRSRRSS
jgi:pimeloyl-ACP methyl ester carboxylesterase